MANTKKLIQAAAGAAGGEALNVEDVFSTYLYEGFGTSTDKQIVNGVNLADEGGMVWIKSRTTTQDNTIFDTERGVHGYIVPNKTDAQYTPSGDRGLQSYNTDGFTIPSTSYFGGFDQASSDLASWTFRKAPKFFDVVTWTGNGTAGRQISHNLGTTPGCIIVKVLDYSGVESRTSWNVYHRGASTGFLNLNLTDALNTADMASKFGDGTNPVAPTDSVFTVGADYSVNHGNGYSYVAYLFAHNNGDGEFGPDGDADIIKCGSYTGNGTSDSSSQDIDLGFEAQWVLIKNTTDSAGWYMIDNMRGMSVNASDGYLYANSTAVEGDETNNLGVESHAATSSGFRVSGAGSQNNQSGYNYIYIAIRRGPMAVPTDATDVFTPELGDGSSDPGFNAAPSPIDFFIRHNRSGASPLAGSRLTGRNYLNTSNTAAESTSTTFDFDYMNGFYNSSSGTTEIAWMWKRAPSFCDVVAYTGNGVAGRTVSHNLGVAPEMIWVKDRSVTKNWMVYTATTGIDQYLLLNDVNAATGSAGSNIWGSSSPTDTSFQVSSSSTQNASGDNYIAYLFASLDGVSKVGSFSHTNGGGDTNVDCGFSSGARFVLYKQYDSSGGWYVLDSTRGIVAGNDPALLLNSTAAEDSSYDQIDPYSSGFTIPSDGVGTGDYIFYAIA